MSKDELKAMLKENLKFKVSERYDGSTEWNGNKVAILFDNEEIASFYLWENDNAGIATITDDFFDE